MDTESLNCPNCGAALRAGPKDSTALCLYCHSTIRITTRGAGESILMVQGADGVSLSLLTTQQIQQLLREGRRVEAIKLYSEETKRPLKASKEAVDAMAKSMGIEVGGAGGSRWSCVGVLVGFLLWMVVLVLTPAGVERVVELMFEDALSGEAIETLQVVGTLFLALGSVAGLLVWASVRSEGKQRRNEDEGE